MCKEEENAHFVNKVLTLEFSVEITLDPLTSGGPHKTQNSLAYLLIFKDVTAHRTMPSTHSANMGRNIYLLPPHIWLAGVSAH